MIFYFFNILRKCYCYLYNTQLRAPAHHSLCLPRRSPFKLIFYPLQLRLNRRTRTCCRQTVQYPCLISNRCIWRRRNNRWCRWIFNLILSPRWCHSRSIRTIHPVVHFTFHFSGVAASAAACRVRLLGQLHLHACICVTFFSHVVLHRASSIVDLIFYQKLFILVILD